MASRFQGDNMSVCAYFGAFFMVAYKYRQCYAVISWLVSLPATLHAYNCTSKIPVRWTGQCYGAVHVGQSQSCGAVAIMQTKCENNIIAFGLDDRDWQCERVK